MNNRLSFFAIVLLTSINIVAMPPKKQPTPPRKPMAMSPKHQAMRDGACRLARAEAAKCKMRKDNSSYCKDMQRIAQHGACTPNK